jgi:hypothetical protein
MHGTVHEVVAQRFLREQPTLQPLPKQRYDTSYIEHRHVSWDSYIEVRGNRYSVPANLVGRVVLVRISLDERVRVFADEVLVATHQLQPVSAGWVTVAEHHHPLWESLAAQVERRSLSVYEEIVQQTQQVREAEAVQAAQEAAPWN